MSLLKWNSQQTVLTLFCSLILLIAQSSAAAKSYTPEEYQARELKIVSHLVTNYHFDKPKIDDAYAKRVLAGYFSLLDPQKIYFIKSDFDRYSVERLSNISRALKSFDVSFIFDIFQLFQQRVGEFTESVNSLVTLEHNYQIDETLQRDRTNADWFGATQDLRDYQRRVVKGEILFLMNQGLDRKLANAEIRSGFAFINDRVQLTESKDIYHTFMSAFMQGSDGLSNYFPGMSKKNYERALSLVGIGVQVKLIHNHPVILDVISGGSAQVAGVLPGDVITGIGYDGSDEIRSIFGWSLEETIEALRGKAGSVVTLRLSNPLVSSRKVLVTRKKVKLKDQAVSSRIVTLNSRGAPSKVGLIRIPAFYFDYEASVRGDKNVLSATNDVKNILRQLGDDISGVVLDFRGNAGGSLTEAAEMAGLFVGNKPTLQIANSEGKISKEKSKTIKPIYAGPLAILVDRNSAGSAEYVAGALQEYKRGIIYGEQTVGLGDIRNLADLNRYDEKKTELLGQLSVKIAQTYRLSGAPFTKKGVTPDVPLGPQAGVAKSGGRATAYPRVPKPIKAIKIKKGREFEANPEINKKDCQLLVAEDEQAAELIRQQLDQHELLEDNKISLNIREPQLRISGLIPPPIGKTDFTYEANSSTEIDPKELDPFLRITAQCLLLSNGAQ